MRQGLVAAALAAVAVTGCSAPPASTAPPAPSETPVATARDASAAADPAGPVLTFADARLAATADGLAPPAYPVRTNPDGTWLTRTPRTVDRRVPAGRALAGLRAHPGPGWRDRAERWQAPLASETTHDDTDLGFKMFMTFAVDHQLTGDESASRRRWPRRTPSPHASTRPSGDPRAGTTRRHHAVPGQHRRDDEPGAPVLGRAERAPAVHRHREPARAAHHGRPRAPRRQHVDVRRLRRGHRRAERTYRCRASRTTHVGRGRRGRSTGSRRPTATAQDPRYLETANRTADSVSPGTCRPTAMPYWDFDVPQAPPQPRDTSAAAIASSALLELSQLDPARAAGDVDAARGMLSSLSSPEYLARTPCSPTSSTARRTCRGPAGLGDHVRRLLLRRGPEPLGAPGRAVRRARMMLLAG